MPFTQYSDQEAFGLNHGVGPTAKSIQEIANEAYGSASSTQYSLQYILNTNLGYAPTKYSDQEALWLTLQADLDLEPPMTRYSVQELLNMAYTGEVSVAQTLDDGEPEPEVASALLMETGDALLMENGNTLIMEG